jgi:anti-anti-sigma factor
MNITVEKKDQACVISIEGRIDTTNYNEFENKVNEAAGANTKFIVLNCEKMNYISSSGLRVFLILQKKMMASGGVLKICCLQPTIKEIFDISGFSSIFTIAENCEEALS